MDQRPSLGGPTLPSGDDGGAAIDDPETAQPSIGPFGQPEAGSQPGLIDTPGVDGLLPDVTDPFGENNRDNDDGGLIPGLSEA